MINASLSAPGSLSVLILTKNEAKNLALLLPTLFKVLNGENLTFECVIVDAGSADGTSELVEKFPYCRLLQQIGKGYGAAFREGVAACQGDYILTLDADLSHPPTFVRAMIRSIGNADVLIGSRFAPGGDARMEFYRKVLSRILGLLFGNFLGVPVKDVSSGFRLYKRSVLQSLLLSGRDFDILIEVLVRIVSEGYTVREVPFIYEPREAGHSNARLFKFAESYLKTLWRMWKLRNSYTTADYEERAYNSIIPLQRWWNRARFKKVTALLDRNLPTLDVGSGSSRITRSFSDAIALDPNRGALRFLSTRGVVCMEGSLNTLPFADSSFDQVIFNEVIQQIPEKPASLSEIRRVLKPGGKLLLGTPDYSSPLWRLLENICCLILPESHSRAHISKYSQEEILTLLKDSGFQIEKEDSILGADRFYLATKPI